MNGLLRPKADRLLGELHHAEQALAEEKERRSVLGSKLAAAVEAQEILQIVAAKVQHQAHEQIAKVVTHCLKAVYGADSYDFRILFERKRGKTEARMVFIKDGHEVSPKDAAGGGVVDLAAFALRLSCIMLTTPPLRRLVIADEPFKNVNGDLYRQRTATLVEKLAEDLNFQFVLATGFRWLRIGQIINVGGSDG